MQSITTIGLDIAKSAFQVHGVDAAGQDIQPASPDTAVQPAKFELVINLSGIPRRISLRRPN
jgi:hypothetical protein